MPGKNTQIDKKKKKAQLLVKEQHCLYIYRHLLLASIDLYTHIQTSLELRMDNYLSSIG